MNKSHCKDHTLQGGISLWTALETWKSVAWCYRCKNMVLRDGPGRKAKLDEAVKRRKQTHHNRTRPIYFGKAAKSHVQP